MSKARKITLGTKEWADSNVNCYFGCSNDCKYCYAKKMAIRFNRKTEDSWKIMVPNLKSIEKGYRKRKGRVMFPTSHDITNVSLEHCLTVLRKLLKAENSVLITTKPKYECIKAICSNFVKFKNLILFRFTITSINNDFLEFWESYAPTFEERLESLKYAYNKDFKTSISIEPFLDKDPYILANRLRPFTTESIWIGKMNYVNSYNTDSNSKRYFDFVRKINSRNNLIEIVRNSKNYPEIIRIKDSIFNYISSL